MKIYLKLILVLFFILSCDSIDEVNRLQEQADQAIESLSKGETKDIAQTMIAVEKANVSFQLMTQVRNRLIEAYQEIMRMQS